jgi:hypothetical protein
MDVGIRRADHAAVTSPTSGGRSASIVPSRTQAKEFSFLLVLGDEQDKELIHCCDKEGY